MQYAGLHSRLLNRGGFLGILPLSCLYTFWGNVENMLLFQKLKRRNVFCVAVAYIIVAWLKDALRVARYFKNADDSIAKQPVGLDRVA